MWLIPLAIFVLAFVKSWSLREALNETVWFSVAYIGSLGLIYGAEQVGFGYISTSPTGIGGVVAILVGFIAMWIRHRRWQKEVAAKKAARAAAAEAERARRAAAGMPAQQKSLIVDAFRFAGSVQRNRKSARRQSQQ